MVRERKVMSAACVKSSGSDVRCEVSFTSFILDAVGKGRQCTGSESVVEYCLNQ